MFEVAQRVEMLASVGCRSVQVVVLRIYMWLPTKLVNATETPTIILGDPLDQRVQTVLGARCEA
jgi:hypothetical protein